MICAGAIFQQASLRRVRLEHASAAASVWDHSQLDGISFHSADLAYARFDHATGTAVDLRQANLTQASFHNARFEHAPTSGARVTRMSGTSAARLAAEARSLSLEMH